MIFALLYFGIGIALWIVLARIDRVTSGRVFEGEPLGWFGACFIWWPVVIAIAALAVALITIGWCVAFAAGYPLRIPWRSQVSSGEADGYLHAAHAELEREGL